MVTTMSAGGDEYLIAICADGAGSASCAGKGSQIVCNAFTAAAQEALWQPPEQIVWDRSLIVPWI